MAAAPFAHNRAQQGDVWSAAASDDVARLVRALSLGASTEEQDAHGRTALHIASERGATAAIRVLLAAGASVTQRVLSAALDPRIRELLQQKEEPFDAVIARSLRDPALLERAKHVDFLPHQRSKR